MNFSTTLSMNLTDYDLYNIKSCIRNYLIMKMINKAELQMNEEYKPISYYITETNLIKLIDSIITPTTEKDVGDWIKSELKQKRKDFKYNQRDFGSFWEAIITLSKNDCRYTSFQYLDKLVNKLKIDKYEPFYDAIYYDIENIKSVWFEYDEPCIFEKVEKIREQYAVKKIENYYLRAKYSPHTELGKRFINKMYDDL